MDGESGREECTEEKAAAEVAAHGFFPPAPAALSSPSMTAL